MNRTHSGVYARAQRPLYSTITKGALSLFLLVLCVACEPQETRSVIQKGHTGEVLAIASDNEGRYVMTGGRDRTLRIRNAEGPLIRVIPRFGAEVTAIATPPRGTVVAAGCADGTLRLFRTDDGTLLFQSVAHERSITSLSFHPGGAYFASLAHDGILAFWDRTGARLAFVPDRSVRAPYCAFLADPPHVVSVAEKGAIELHTLEGDHVVTIPVAHGTVSSVIAIRRGRAFAAGFSDGTVRIYTAAGAEDRVFLSGLPTVTALAYDEETEGGALFVAGFSRVRRFVTGEERPQKEFATDETRIRGIATIASRTNGIAVAGKTTSFYDKEGTPIYRDTEAPALFAVAWDADDARVIFGGNTRDVICVSLSGITRWEGRMSSVRAIAGNGTAYVTAGVGGRAIMYNTGGAFRHILSPEIGSIAALSFFAKGARFAAGGEKGVAAYNVKGEVLWRHETRGEGAVTALAYDTKHNLLLALTRSATLLRFTPAGALAPSLTYPSATGTLAYSSLRGEYAVALQSGRFAVTFDDTVRIETLQTGALPITSLAYNAEGNLLAFGTFAKVVIIRDLATGEERVLRGHTGSVTRVLFHPTDANRLVSVSDDGTLRVWNVQTGESIVFFVGGEHAGVVLDDKGMYTALGRGEELILFLRGTTPLPSASVKQHDTNVLRRALTGD